MGQRSMKYAVLILAFLCIAASPRDNTEALLGMSYLLDMDLGAYPGILPAQGRVTSGYGFRRDPITRGIRYHRGLDICNVRGTVVRASGGGTVTYAGWRQGYGYCIEITSGRLTTLYGHLLTIGVPVGRKVKRGDRIGCMGDSGRATGYHLHYETRINEVPVDPAKYFR